MCFTLGGPIPASSTRIARIHAIEQWEETVQNLPGDKLKFLSPVGVVINVSQSRVSAILPYWFMVLASGTLAMAFRMRWPPQFTLRNLFVAMTFLAVVLGMIALHDTGWMSKRIPHAGKSNSSDLFSPN
jgi:hypothetical protein